MTLAGDKPVLAENSPFEAHRIVRDRISVLAEIRGMAVRMKPPSRESVGLGDCVRFSAFLSPVQRGRNGTYGGIGRAAPDL